MKGAEPMSASNVVTQIRKATRKRFTAEQKIRVVLEGLRGQQPVTELCRREGIAPAQFYKWSKTFLDSGKHGLTLEVRRGATYSEVAVLKEENEALKRALAENSLEIMRLKKNLGLL
jgi:transposase